MSSATRSTRLTLSCTPFEHAPHTLMCAVHRLNTPHPAPLLCPAQHPQFSAQLASLIELKGKIIEDVTMATMTVGDTPQVECKPASPTSEEVLAKETPYNRLMYKQVSPPPSTVTVTLTFTPTLTIALHPHLSPSPYPHPKQVKELKHGQKEAQETIVKNLNAGFAGCEECDAAQSKQACRSPNTLPSKPSQVHSRYSGVASDPQTKETFDAIKAKNELDGKNRLEDQMKAQEAKEQQEVRGALSSPSHCPSPFSVVSQSRIPSQDEERAMKRAAERKKLKEKTEELEAKKADKAENRAYRSGWRSNAVTLPSHSLPAASPPSLVHVQSPLTVARCSRCPYSILTVPVDQKFGEDAIDRRAHTKTTLITVAAGHPRS